MSILNENYNPVDYLTPALQISEIKSDAKSIYKRLHDGVRYSTEMFWQNQYFTPEQMATAAGTSGAELFQLHTIAIQALEQAIPGSTNDIVSLIKPHKINSDGTITIL